MSTSIHLILLGLLAVAGVFAIAAAAWKVIYLRRHLSIYAKDVPSFKERA